MLANYPNSGRIYAVSRPQQRFNWPNALFEVTSACSASPYRDELFGPEFSNSVFICEPANNVIHREVLQPQGISFSSHRSAEETNSEFFASTDNWCRPVMVKTGPDGALYFADMYRLIIEHPEYFPDELKHRPDLRAGDDKGRIYRIFPVGATPRKIPRLEHLTSRELVAALDSPNGWQRDTVQRLLVQSPDVAAIKPLESLMQHSGNPRARLQALCSLDGLNSLSPHVLLIALHDSHYAVRRHAVLLSESPFGESADLDLQLLTLANDPDLRVRYQLAFSLGEWNDRRAGEALGRIALQDWSDSAMQTAVMSSARRHLEAILTVMFDTPRDRLPPGMVERLVGLAADISQPSHPDILARALDKLATPSAVEFSGWQMAGLAGLLDALERRNTSLTEFRDQATPEVQTLI